MYLCITIIQFITRALIRLERTMNLIQGRGGEGREVGEEGRGGREGGRGGREGGRGGTEGGREGGGAGEWGGRGRGRDDCYMYVQKQSNNTTIFK